MTESQSTEVFALKLYGLGALRFEKCRWRIHREKQFRMLPLFPLYVNLRQAPKGPLRESDTQWLGKWLYEFVRRCGVRTDYIVGVPDGGVPLAQAFMESAWNDGWRASLLRFEKETYRLLGGAVIPGRSVLVIEDVISFATSSVDLARVLHGTHKLEVRGCVACLDHELGGTTRLVRELVSTYVVATTSLIMRALFNRRLVTEDICKEVMEHPQRVRNFFHEHCLPYPC